MKKFLSLSLFVVLAGVSCSAMEWDVRGKYVAAKPHSHIGFIYESDLAVPSAALGAMELSDLSTEEVFPVKFNFDDKRGCQQFILEWNRRVSWYPDKGKVEVVGLDPDHLSKKNNVRMLAAVQYFDAKNRGLIK